MQKKFSCHHAVISFDPENVKSLGQIHQESLAIMTFRLFTKARWSTQDLARFYVILFVISVYIFFSFIKSDAEFNNDEIMDQAKPKNGLFSPHRSSQYNRPLTEADISSGKGNLAQDDPRLLDYIISQYLIPPRPKGKHYEVDWTPVHLTNKLQQQEVSRYILDLFNKKVSTIS